MTPSSRDTDLGNRVPSAWGVILAYATSLFVPAIAVLAGVTMWLHWRRVHLRAFGLMTPGWIGALRLAGVGVALASVSGGLQAVLFWLVSKTSPEKLGPWFLSGLPNDLTVLRCPSLASIAIYFGSVVIVAPFLEELVFRGCVYTRWEERWGFVRAALASSTVFAVLHFNPAAPGSLVLGFLACTIYRGSGNLFGPVLVHFVHNLALMSVALTVLASGASTVKDLVRLSESLLPISLAVLGLGAGLSVCFAIPDIRRAF